MTGRSFMVIVTKSTFIILPSDDQHECEIWKHIWVASVHGPHIYHNVDRAAHMYLHHSQGVWNPSHYSQI